MVGDNTAEWDIPGSKAQHVVVPAASLLITYYKLELISPACSEIFVHSLASLCIIAIPQRLDVLLKTLNVTSNLH